MRGKICIYTDSHTNQHQQKNWALERWQICTDESTPKFVLHHTKITQKHTKTDKQEQKKTSKQTRTKSLFIILGSNSWWLGAPKNWVSWGENINVNHKNHKMLINRKHGYSPQKITYKPLWLLAETHSYLSLSPTIQAQYCNICQNILHTVCL